MSHAAERTDPGTFICRPCKHLDLNGPFEVFSLMDVSAKMALIVGMFSLTTMINLLFGYLRNRTRKFSVNWFLCIHLPIPLIFVARTFSHLGFTYIPLFVIAALTGQILGGKMEF